MGGGPYPGLMPLEVNRPEVMADITAVFERYEAALVANDVDTLDELFWDSPEIVRFGLAERQTRMQLGACAAITRTPS